MDNEKVIIKALRERSKPMAKKAKAKVKRKRLEKVSTIQNRLMKLWLNRIYEIYNRKCAICGDTVKPNAHHIVNRDVSPALRFDPNNGIALCASCHRFGLLSAHKNGVWFGNWLMEHAPKQYKYIVDNSSKRINIRDREELYRLEAILLSDITDDERDFHGERNNA